jgi:hypothetical protein
MWGVEGRAGTAAVGEMREMLQRRRGAGLSCARSWKCEADPNLYPAQKEGRLGGEGGGD